MMFAPYEFYKAFLVDFFILKQATYKNILDNFDKVEPIILNGVEQYAKEDYLNTLKSSIRVTYFHCIETLFEIMFAIEAGIRSEENERQDELILQRLLNSDYRKNFKRISKIASGDRDALAAFDDKIYLKRTGHDMSVLQYLFYYTLTPRTFSVGSHWWEKLEPSLKAIKNAIIILAKDFSDRGEYNSYKHGLRIIPMKSKFEAFDLTGKAILSLDFVDSMTFLQQSKEEFSFVTKNFDTERDHKMTILASELMANIINIRKSVYFNKDGEKINLGFLEHEFLKAADKTNIKSRYLKFIWNLRPGSGFKA